MTDEPERIEVKGSDDDGPDGIIVIHHPADGSDPYGVGPFPPVPDLVDAIIVNGPCSCRKVPLPIAFPKGITMMVDASSMAEDIAKKIMGDGDAPMVILLPASMVEKMGFSAERREAEAKKERLN